jgi:hypothetical protein
MGALKRRTADLGDIKEIWELVKAAAEDMAFDAANPAAQEAMLSQIMVCCTSGLSPLAVADSGGLVGALLVRRDELEWGLRNSPAVHVAAAAARREGGEGALAALFGELQAAEAPVFVSVRKGDRLGLDVLLRERGFAHEASAESGWGDLYAWSAKPAVH